MFVYPVELEPDDNGTVMATFPDVPEAVTFGDDEDDALARAVDALETALAGYIEDRRHIPAPSAANGRRTVALPLLAQVKLETYEAMRARGWRKADLARALGLGPRQVDRIFDLTHGTSISQLDAALAACGRRFVIETKAA